MLKLFGGSETSWTESSWPKWIDTFKSKNYSILFYINFVIVVCCTHMYFCKNTCLCDVYSRVKIILFYSILISFRQESKFSLQDSVALLDLNGRQYIDAYVSLL